MTAFTVRQATATGKSDPTYGDEYIVHFEEDEREVKMSRKVPPVPGQTENGTINANKYGAYFKKDPYNPNAPKATAPTGSTAKAVSKPAYNQSKASDGQRQGMCINNAANFVNTQHPADPARLPLNYTEWANEVHSYASALYALGDLKIPITEETVAGVFNQ